MTILGRLSPLHGPGDPSANAVRGLEAVFEYNGLALNEGLTSADMYVVSDIGGLDDADIRDQREAVPSDHGEIPLDMFYGGRTITLQGYIRAGNLEKLRNMQNALKQAASPTTESTLKMRYFDWSDTFSVNTLPWYTFDSGASANCLISNGVLSIPGAPSTTHNLIRTNGVNQNYDSGDGSMVFFVNSATWADGLYAGGVFRLDANNYIYCYIARNGGYRLGVDKVVAGVGTNIALFPMSTPTANVGFYVRVTLDNNIITVERFATFPTRTSTALESILTYQLSTAEATQFSNGVLTKRGILLRAMDSTAYIDSFYSTSAKPLFDTQIDCRKSAGLAMAEAQVDRATGGFRRNFQLTLRASKPFFLSTYLNRAPTSSQVYQNYVSNPSFETDVSVWATGAPAFWLNAGAAIVRDLTAFKTGIASGKVTTAAGTANTGVSLSMSPTAGFIANTNYTAQVAIKGNAGGETLALFFGDISADSAALAITATTSWVVYTVAWIPSSNHATAYIGVRATTTTQRVFFMDSAMATVGGTQTYFDGSTGNAVWDGAVNLSTSTFYPGGTGIALASYARAYPKTYSFFYNKFINSLGSILTSGNDQVLNNVGTWPAYPIIRLNGPLTNPTVKNQTNGQIMYLSGTIASTDYIDIDILNRTLIDSSGANRFGMLLATSNWLTLSPGNNTISLFTTTTGTGNCVIWWRNTWI